MSKSYSGIDVIACVQGNTARSLDTIKYYEGSVKEHNTCVVYNFKGERAGSSRPEVSETTRRRAIARRKAARMRARKVRILRTTLTAFILISVVFGIGGIASIAKSKEAPEAYKYYDTITVAYEENLLDVVQRYDDRNFYKTQNDYLEELCRINNLDYDKSSYPVVTPGTHLVVPYYSTELK